MQTLVSQDELCSMRLGIHPVYITVYYQAHLGNGVCWLYEPANCMSNNNPTQTQYKVNKICFQFAGNLSQGTQRIHGH
jgi:hypothetical protein